MISRPVDTAARDEIKRNKGKMACRFCGRMFMLKPGGLKGSLVFPYHNVSRRTAKGVQLPPRCIGSDIMVQVQTEEEVDASLREELIIEILKVTKQYSIDYLRQLSSRDLEDVWWMTTRQGVL